LDQRFKAATCMQLSTLAWNYKAEEGSFNQVQQSMKQGL